MVGTKGPPKRRRIPCAASFLKTSAGRILTTRMSGFSASKRSSLLSTSALWRAENEGGGPPPPPPPSPPPALFPRGGAPRDGGETGARPPAPPARPPSGGVSPPS